MSGQEASALKRQPSSTFIHILWPCLSHLFFLIFNPSEISSVNYFLLMKGAICIFSCNINIKVSEFNQFSKYYVAEENEKLRQWARAQYVL